MVPAISEPPAVVPTLNVLVVTVPGSTAPLKVMMIGVLVATSLAPDVGVVRLTVTGVSTINVAALLVIESSVAVISVVPRETPVANPVVDAIVA